MKPESNNEPDPGPEEEPRLPSTEVLALISATMLAGGKMDHHAALRSALRLWKAADAKLMDLRARHANDEIEEDITDELLRAADEFPKPMLPERFPADWKMFSKLVIQTKEPEATKRLRDYYRDLARSWNQEGNTPQELAQSIENLEKEAAEHLGNCKKSGFADLYEWVSLAVPYRKWWEYRFSFTKREAGKKGARSRKKKT